MSHLHQDVPILSNAGTVPPSCGAVQPASIPNGMLVELSRARILPGKEAICDEWMEMLNNRLDECTATLAGERMALEVAFRRKDDDGEWIYWVSIFGHGGGGLDERSPLDREHIAYARACKEPGWEEAKPALLLASPAVREAIIQSVVAPTTNEE